MRGQIDVRDYVLQRNVAICSRPSAEVAERRSTTVATNAILELAIPVAFEYDTAVMPFKRSCSSKDRAPTGREIGGVVGCRRQCRLVLVHRSVDELPGTLRVDIFGTEVEASGVGILYCGSEGDER